MYREFIKMCEYVLRNDRRNLRAMRGGHIRVPSALRTSGNTEFLRMHGLVSEHPTNHILQIENLTCAHMMDKPF